MVKADQIEIVEFEEPVPYIYSERTGPYFVHGAVLTNLLSFSVSEERKLMSVWLDDPDVTPKSELRSRCGLQLLPTDEIPAGAKFDWLPLGRYAKLTFKGNYSGLAEAWEFFYTLWFPHSGERSRPGIPAFEMYMNCPEQVPLEELVTELYIPLK